MLTLSEAEVAKLLTWERLIPAMKGALAAFSSAREKKSATRSATTVFKSVGIATEDIVTARLVYEEASRSS